MSSMASGTAPTTKSAVCIRKTIKSATLSVQFHRSSSSSSLPMLSSLNCFLAANSAKLLNPNGGSVVSSSPKPFRPVMQWQDVTVKMVVDAPAAVAYKLYADRELFPKWMPFVSSVEAMEDRPELSRYLVKLESFGQNIEYHFLAKNLQRQCSIFPERSFLLLSRDEFFI
ncbi:PREDICTED: uncharacterized protein LOC104759799 [Camelina sativa]|uniref:Uncharacterized protein LOC104759799 n=1 Tax=Camelina sativa TaxID=90675 RepID=A0ABM0X5E9_CAMSA|nr:PREDICTED: uncharacterized protein LOC104759799 [Camelina sativa]XP_010480991.1 PREDICTED: uncharacterized protein LOC104759799 [Camelina sativa]